jgi:hypothetical protein
VRAGTGRRRGLNRLLLPLLGELAVEHLLVLADDDGLAPDLVRREEHQHDAERDEQFAEGTRRDAGAVRQARCASPGRCGLQGDVVISIRD